MATWKKVVLGFLVVIVAIFPVFPQTSAVHALSNNENSIVLPIGNELSDDELFVVEGEIPWWAWVIVVAVVGGISVGGSYCIIEAMHGRTPRWDVGMALFGFGTLVTAIGFYASVRASTSSHKILADLVPYSSANLIPENAARWRF
ncbi:MAG: hypothetical protein ACP5PX_07305 [Candidatus Hadarchaeum sp.]|uniref:hypothetical protein n=1 Tax=Candidatus Hadarchaeum sp. TaxID=2883567 RepID=UPI003D0AB9FA